MKKIINNIFSLDRNLSSVHTYNLEQNISQSNFFAALCIIFAIFRPFCDIIADM